MLATLYPCLRERANFCFSRFNRTPASREKLCALFSAAVKTHKGVAVSELCHGMYAYPQLMAEMMPLWAEMNVTRFYTEMVPASKQGLLDQWQDKRDDKGITDYFDSEHVGYSKRMWAYYWLMLQAADENNIRVVGVDNPEIISGYGAVFDAPFKTMHWEGIIKKDQASAGMDERYVVYGGEAHMVDKGGELKGIHQRMGIPRIMMQEGAYSIASHPLDQKPSFTVAIPRIDQQDPLASRRNVRNNPVKWPV